MNRILLHLFVILLNVSSILAASGDIKTIAGSLDVEYTGRNTQRRWIAAKGVCVDNARGVYVADAIKHRIVRINPDSTLTIVAGKGWTGYSGDGHAAIQAELNTPSDILKTPQGELLIADTGNHCIRKIDVEGNIHTLAGNGIAGFSGDNGPAQNAKLSTPRRIFLDHNDHLYIADAGNHRIRKIDTSTGMITTIAGDGYKNEKGQGRFSGDGGPATQASLFYPADVVVDTFGTIYVADSNNKRIRKISPQGQITTLLNIRLSYQDYAPHNLLVKNNKLYFTDYSLNRLNMKTGIIDTLKTHSKVQDIFSDDLGNIGISTDHTILKKNFDDSFSISYQETRHTTPVSTYYGDTLQATDAGIYRPRSIWTDNNSNIYIADTGNHRVRKISPTGIITTFAGNGTKGFSGDGGPAKNASLSGPYDICGDNQGNIYIADTGNNRIRKVDSQGFISTYAGNGNRVTVVQHWIFIQTPPEMPSEDVKDGILATQALLSMPMGVSVDASDNLYIADTGHHRIRKVNESGFISTVAGKGFGQRPTYYDVGSRSRYLLGDFSGDGGLAQEAHLQNPVDICFDQNNNLYIADTGNHRIRKVDAQTHLISTIAGNDEAFWIFAGGLLNPPLSIGKMKTEEYPAISTSLNFPMSMSVTATGYIFIADSYNHRIRVLLPKTGTLKTISGTSHWGSGSVHMPYPEFVIGFYFADEYEVGNYAGDNGPAIDARFNVPSRICFNQKGDLYIADTENHRIRVIENVLETIISDEITNTIEQSDFNGDKSINFLDFIIFAGHFNSKAGDFNFDATCDLNGDGVIGFLDFIGFTNNFGKTYP